MTSGGTHWIAVDWGTSTLRAWAIAHDDSVLHHATSPDGMAAIAASGGDFESALLDLISPWLPDDRTIDVVACGMVGARQGWSETPYAPCPCPPTPPLHRAPTRTPGLRVNIVTGIKQETPPDVMRGEETQIAGLLHAQPDFSGTVCLPGTHSKWVSVKEGKIERFQTFMTGELFDLLANSSVLSQTVASEGFHDTEFLQAFQETLANPQQILAQTFGIRPAALLKNLPPAAARSRLSGHLIGLELAGAHSQFPLSKVALIGAPQLTDLYRIALGSLDSTITIHEPAGTTLDGLRLAFQSTAP